MSSVRTALRGRWKTFGAIVLGAAAVLVVLPAFGSSHPDADRLRLTEDHQLFFYGDSDPDAAGVDRQFVTLGNKGCGISFQTTQLVTLSSNSGGGIKGPGYVDYGIGVKSGGSNGTPCSEIDGLEKLTVTSQNMWFEAFLDVEVKGSVHVRAVMRDDGGIVATHELLTGDSINGSNEIPEPGPIYYATTTSADTVAACADPNDSGPDANLKDNCLWSIQPGVAFDSITLYAVEGIGTVSLEGGSDYEAADPGGFAAGEYDTLFYRALSPQDDFYSVDEDVELAVAAPGVLVNDGTTGATVSLVSGPAHGSLDLDSDGSFTYTGAQDNHDDVTFTYEASTGAESAQATVDITVNPVNDDPVAVAGPLTASEDMSETYSGDELATDVDDADLTVIFASANMGDASIVNGELVYTPPADFCGSDQITLTFEVSDDGTPPGTTGQSTVTINVACAADDDTYLMDERTQGENEDPNPATLTVTAPGVLSNDTNDVTEVTATELDGPATGTLNLAADGGFDYTPALLTPEEWGTDTSREVTWTYTATYADSSTDTATVTITINRNLCQTDTVEDQAGDVYGSFTLLSSTGCKNWVPVIADPVEETILFQPDTPGTTGIYDGTLSIENVTVVDGVLDDVILKYDPTGGTNYGPVPSCEGTSDAPVLPGGDSEGWCFYDVELDLTGDDENGALWTITWKVRGWDDPGWSFR